MPTLPNALLDRVTDPSADPAVDRSRLTFAAGLIGMGVLHFVVPKPFEKIVPKWIPWRRGAVLWSGVAELASGALLAMPATTKAGGWLAAGTIVAVYPANLQMAVDATRNPDAGKFATAVTWLRLPLQVPMVLRALRYTR
ncbi:MAG: hypothetical protein M3Y51_00230 [Actinomycetota bacterium]|nr:hypothetical protein [Actinomycetota bacterium]